MTWEDANLVKILQENGVVVMPTDTLYGIVGKALNTSVVQRIYVIKKRASQKPYIILIGNTNELEKFSINLSLEQKNKLKEYWPASPSLGGPGPTSIVLDCPDASLQYLHRGTKSLAFRLPAQEELQNLLLKTGPLVAPSANPERLPPAQDVTGARGYFKDLVDLYVDGGTIKGKASKVIKLHEDGSISIIRE